MNKQDIVNHFGSERKVAKALDISQASVNAWKVVPDRRQLQIERLTKKALKADKGCAQRLFGVVK
jgi:DNA-binding transcriptional regulator YdaS (Cro superfamily)